MKATRLEKFLINRGLLESFKKNTKHRRGYATNVYIHTYGYNRDAIDKAFEWSDSPENLYFWMNIDREWRECLKNNTL